MPKLVKTYNTDSAYTTQQTEMGNVKQFSR